MRAFKFKTSHIRQYVFRLALSLGVLLCIPFASITLAAGTVMPYRLVSTVKTAASDEARCLYFASNGLMLIGTNSGLKVYDGYNITVLKSTASAPRFLPNNNVVAIAEDRKDNLWLGTRNGVMKFSMRTMVHKTYPSESKEQPWINTLFTDHAGRVWKGTSKGLYFYDESKDTFRRQYAGQTWVVTPSGRRARVDIGGVMTIAEDRAGNLYFGTWSSGLFKLDAQRHTLYSYPQINSHNSVYSLFFDSRQRLWIGTWGYGYARMDRPANPKAPALSTYNRGSGSFDTYYKFIEEPITHTIWGSTREGVTVINFDGDLSPVEQYTHCGAQGEQPLRFCNGMATDAQGNVWIETLNDGVVHISTKPVPFKFWDFRSAGYQLPVNSVVGLYMADSRHVWCAMKPYGLALVDLTTGRALFNRQIPGFANLPDNFMRTSITSIVRRYNGELWMANNSYGVAVYTPGQQVRVYNHENSSIVFDDYVNALCQAHNRVMWVGQNSRLSVAYPDNSGRLLTMKRGKEDMSHCDVRHIMEDSKGRIWVSTDNEGIVRVEGNAFKPSTLRFKFYLADAGNLAVDDATACFEDSRHRIWAISNSGGLFLYDPKGDRFESVNTRFNIPGDRIFAITEDCLHNLWMTTDNALLRLTPDGEPRLRIYGEGDGLTNLLFYPNVAYRQGDTLLFARQTGLLYFSSKSIGRHKASKSSNLIVNNILLDEESYTTIEGELNTEVADVTPMYARRITVPARINKVSVEYALLDYGNSRLTHYAYKLDGYDKDWHFQNGPMHRATYENLPAGTYYLQVKAEDSNGNWTELPYKLEMRILPPWWATWWAKLLYVLLALFIVAAVLHEYGKRLHTRNRLQMMVVFTNMAHELLTPLSIISATIDELRQKAPEHEQQYGLMQGNINRVTRLLRQILEVRKSQAGQLKLEVNKMDLSDFVAHEMEGFKPLAAKKGCQLHVDLPSTPVQAYADGDKLDKILYNLVSNAIKYSHDNSNIWVKLSVEDDHAVLEVKDEGIGIDPERKTKLFTRFLDGDYRRMGTTGTGIGLSLTHDLVTLHHGTIDCQSEEGKGTTFTVKLPIRKSDYLPQELLGTKGATATQANDAIEAMNEPVESLPKPTAEWKNYRILIVEDNVELLEVMRKLLGRYYTVLTARNGQQAWNTIQREGLDLVITDVMMPVMDGLELTRLIKQNDDYAQLPVILLTAKTQDEARDEAFKSGADAYIAKPIEMKRLMVRINNIIENRERIRRKFAAQTEEEPETHYSNPDELFVQKAIECVQKHIDDSDYDREQFARDMLVSSSTLYNKLRALTGQNIVGFMTSIRMKEACKILRQEPNILISDLSLRVGFNTPKYFSRCFRNEFGMTIKEFLEKENAKAEES